MKIMQRIVILLILFLAGCNSHPTTTTKIKAVTELFHYDPASNSTTITYEIELRN